MIEAFQMTRERRADNSEWPSWLNEAWQKRTGETGAFWPTNPGTDEETLSIATLEGVHRVTIGDWIIQGVKGELYPCKPDIFEMTYEPVEETTHAENP